jgi:hypothetical protein
VNERATRVPGFEGYCDRLRPIGSRERERVSLEAANERDQPNVRVSAAAEKVDDLTQDRVRHESKTFGSLSNARQDRWIALPCTLEEPPGERVAERAGRPGREAIEASPHCPPSIAIERCSGCAVEKDEKLVG